MQFLLRFSHFISKTFAYWTLAFACLGFFLPQYFAGLGKIIPYLLGIIMFGMGLV